MRRSLRVAQAALLALLIVSCPVFGADWHGRSDCVTDGAQALRLAVVEGDCQSWGRPHVKACLPSSMATPPKGSGNWPVQLLGALAICGDAQAARELVPMLAGSPPWGLNGKESFSLVYAAANLGTVMLMLSVEPEQHRAAVLQRWIRAHLAFLRLHLVPAGTPLEVWIGGVEGERGQGVLERGEYVNPTGDRSVIGADPVRHLIPDRSPLTTLYRWCTGSLNRRKFDPNTRRWTWMPAILADAAGNNGGKPLGPKYCGISAAEVKMLRRPLVKGGEPTATLDLVAQMLGQFKHPGNPARRPVRSRQILGWADGSWASVLSASANANKPAIVFSAYDARLRRAQAVVPSLFRPVRARSATAALHLDDGAVGVASTDGWRHSFQLPGGGLDPVWRLSWSADRGVELFASGSLNPRGPPEGPPAPDSDGAPEPPPPPPSDPAQIIRDRARRQYLRLEHDLIELQKQTEELLRTLRQTRRHFDRAGRDFGLRPQTQKRQQ